MPGFFEHGKEHSCFIESKFIYHVSSSYPGSNYHCARTTNSEKISREIAYGATADKECESDGQALSRPENTTDLIRMYLLTNQFCIDIVNTN